MDCAMESDRRAARHGDGAARRAGIEIADIGAVVEDDVMKRRVVVSPHDRAAGCGIYWIGCERPWAHLSDDRDGDL